MLSAGSKAVDFTVDSTKGGFTLSERVRDSPVLLYFFPMINGKTCGEYLALMIERADEFRDLGIDLVNINHDTMENHRSWIEHTGSPFEDLSDPDLEVCKAYDVIVRRAKSDVLIGKTNRAFMLIDKGMTIRYAWCADIPSETVPMNELFPALKAALNK